MEEKMIVKDKPVATDEVKATDERQHKGAPKPVSGQWGHTVEPVNNVTHCLFVGVWKIKLFFYNYASACNA